MIGHFRGWLVIAAFVALMAVVGLAPAVAQTDTVKVSTAHLVTRGDAAADQVAGAASVTTTSLGITTFIDGNGQMGAGMVIDLYKVAGTGGRLAIVNATGVGVTNGTAGNVYAGVGLRYNVFTQASGWSLDAIAAWKGLTLNTMEISKGWGNLIVGVRFRIPIGPA